MGTRSSFLAGLAGVVAGAVLVGVAPAVAGVGDFFVLGRPNHTQAETTHLTGTVEGPALKVTNLAGGSRAALRVNTTDNAPPFATNSNGRVKNFNADTVDGKHGSDLLSGVSIVTNFGLINPTATSADSLTAECPPGKMPIAGGAGSFFPRVFLVSSSPSGDGWIGVWLREPTASAGPFSAQVWATCADR